MAATAEERRELASKVTVPEKPARKVVRKAPPAEVAPPVKRFAFELSSEDAERFEKVKKMSGSKSDIEHFERALSFYDAMLSTDLDMTYEGDQSEEMLVERSALRSVRSYTLKLVEERASSPPAPAPSPPASPAPRLPHQPVLGAITLSTGRKVKVVLQYPPPVGLSSSEKAQLRTARVVFKEK